MFASHRSQKRRNEYLFFLFNDNTHIPRKEHNIQKRTDTVGNRVEFKKPLKRECFFFVSPVTIIPIKLCFSQYFYDYLFLIAVYIFLITININ